MNALLPEIDDDAAPCVDCGRLCDEAEIEACLGYCPRCGGRWLGTVERTPAFAPTPATATVEQLFGDDVLPF